MTASGNLFSIAKSGLVSYQNALKVTGNNIENVYTPGYSRQAIDFTEINIGGISQGVDASNIQRANNEFLNITLRNSVSSYHRMDTYYDYAATLDLYLGDENASLNKGLSEFFSALENAISSPASITNRDVLLNQADVLTANFHNLADQMTNQFSQVNQQLTASTEQINSLTSTVAQINTKIIGNQGDVSALKDQRDHVLQDLAEYLPINVVNRSNGAANVYLSTGDILVNGGVAASLTTRTNDLDGTEQQVALITSNGEQPISNTLQGGKVGGLLQYRAEVLEPARLELGRIATVLANQFNQQHQEGMDLHDQLGGSFFNDVNELVAQQNRVIASRQNNGSADFLVEIKDDASLQATDYQLSFSNSTDYQLLRLSDTQVIASGSVAGYPHEIDIDGLTIVMDNGSFSAGDRFLVTPLRLGANNMDLKIHDAAAVALALPINVMPANGNTGYGEIVSIEVSDIDNSSFVTPGALTPSITVEFLTDSSYQLINTNTSSVIEGPLTYDANTMNHVFPTAGGYDPGYRVQLTGTVSAGDQFVIDYNTGGKGDNRNGLLLSDLQNKTVFDNNTTTLQQKYNQLASSVATKAHHADLLRQSNEALMQQTQSQRDSVSGVNMDEEAANLLRYTQMFQASAQLISVANNVLDILMGLLE